MRQSLLQPPVYPGARHSAQQGYDHHGEPTAYLCEQRPRAGACDGPAQPEDQTAIYVTFGKRFFRNNHRLPGKRADAEPADQVYAQHARDHGTADHAVHVKRLQPEHFLDTEPGDHFGFYEDDAKKHPYQEVF